MENKTLYDAETIVTNLEDAVIKARCISDILFNEFYECPDITKELILYEYKFARIEHNIINDYLVKMQNDIKLMSEMINSIMKGEYIL